MGSSSSSSPAGLKTPHAAFSATQWSVVLAAGAEDARAAEAALSRLCTAYWFPLYSFVRRGGYSPHDAEDATQGFFADLLRRRALFAADREKGRFRSFLIAAMKNYLSHERERACAAKRGGGEPLIALDAVAAEERYLLEPADVAAPDLLYDRRWALVLLERARTALRAEFAEAGQLRIFEALLPSLSSARGEAYAEVAAHLEMTEGAIKVAVHRLRQRYRAALRAEVAHTVAHPGEIDAELRHLMAALSG